MSQALKLKHVLALVGGSVLIVGASTNISAKTSPVNRTLLQCHELLPDGVQYQFTLTSDIDTRDAEKGQLRISLVDPANPDSNDVPEAAGAFLQCVQQVVGVGGNEGWPEA